MMKRLIFGLVWGLVFSVSVPAHGTVATYEDLTLAPGAHEPRSGGFYSGGHSHFNDYDDWSWGGFSYSNMKDTTTRGYSNEGSAIPGGGANNSNNYAVGYINSYQSWYPEVTLSSPTVVSGAYFTNTTYAYWSMKEGDDFAKKFGGNTGDDEDWFLLTIEGFDVANQSTGKIDFYLANYITVNDYIVDDWTWVDLSDLGIVSSLQFTLDSSDRGDWGMNTPGYFAMDDLTPIPIPAPALLLASGLLALIGVQRKKG